MSHKLLMEEPRVVDFYIFTHSVYVYVYFFNSETLQFTERVPGINHSPSQPRP